MNDNNIIEKNVFIGSQVAWKLVVISPYRVFYKEGKAEERNIVTPFSLIVRTIHAEVK